MDGPPPFPPCASATLVPASRSERPRAGGRAPEGFRRRRRIQLRLLAVAAALPALSVSLAEGIPAERAGDPSSETPTGDEWMNPGGPPYGAANAGGGFFSFDPRWVLGGGGGNGQGKGNAQHQQQQKQEPANPVRFFDVYSRPIRSVYSQVHWTSHGTIPLPRPVVDRYGGKGAGTKAERSSGAMPEARDEPATDTMAVVGYEVDQVRIDPSTGREVPVPITWAYNHHYMAFLLGSRGGDAKEPSGNATFREANDAPRMVELDGHGAIGAAERLGLGHATGGPVWIPEQALAPGVDADALRDGRSWLFFSEGNGGEMRKSCHVYPRGYAQLIRNPVSFSVTPMQIDTWFRDTMPSGRFVPPNGPVDAFLPKSSGIRDLAAAGYNPLLECPCSDRLERSWGMSYALRDLHDDDDDNEGESPEPPGNATECFSAALSLLPSTNATTREIPRPGKERGRCTALLRADGSLDAAWEEPTGSPTGSTTSFQREQSAAGGEPSGAVVGTTPLGSLFNATVVLHAESGTAEIALEGPVWYEGDEEEETGDRWFAVAFGADSMCVRMEADECTGGGPYAIVVLPATPEGPSRVVERRLDYHGPGRILGAGPGEKELLIVRSNRIEDFGGGDGDDEEHQPRHGGETPSPNKNSTHRKRKRKRRVVRLSRPFRGPTPDYFSFAADPGAGAPPPDPVKIVLATGCPGSGGTFGRHCGHQSPGPLVFARVGLRLEVVRDGIKGSIGGKPFGKHCLGEPYGDLVRQKNPTCEVRTYRGGLRCCVHGKHLLDASQEIPWGDRVLEYRLKFRFYYQDYLSGPRREDPPAASSGRAAEEAILRAAPPSHRELARFYWQTEAGGDEYDVPGCREGKLGQGPPPSECVHTITSRWRVRDFAGGEGLSGIELIYAAPHCHAPMCLSMELYNADTGELLCSVEPIAGRGGSGGNDGAYDEEGFLAIPPCLWSHDQSRSSTTTSTTTSPLRKHGRETSRDGPPLLPAPRFLSMDTTLLSIKRANSTFPHTGDMASWQMRGVLVPSTPTETEA
ncbi:unnamed protein product [Pseudo-nitzschia multistriata]|uniref:Uncharacterized protein n=1 Tax=Pseudo-nitzschia multistriata TaxID=183589 RepID=A0A448Z0M5_9STRA|nr:unnamed protein product [Pseudo-nitzschia multistriata]